MKVANTVLPSVLEHVMSIDEVFIEVPGLEPVKVNALFKSFDDAGLFVFHKEHKHWGCNGYTGVKFSLTTLHHSRKGFDALYHTSTLSLQNELLVFVHRVELLSIVFYHFVSTWRAVTDFDNATRMKATANVKENRGKERKYFHSQYWLVRFVVPYLSCCALSCFAASQSCRECQL